MPSTLIIRNARLSFDKNLFEPTEQKGKKPGKRSCNLICSDDTQFFLFEGGKKTPLKRADLTKVIEDVLKAKFGGKVPPKYENWAVRENTASVSATTGERHKGYEDDNGIYFSPSRYEDQGFPAFARPDGSPINMVQADGVAEALRTFYGGCYVSAKITIGAYETKEEGMIKRGVTSYLEALQFLRSGERFGKGAATADGFDAEEPEEEADNEFA